MRVCDDSPPVVPELWPSLYWPEESGFYDALGLDVIMPPEEEDTAPGLELPLMALLPLTPLLSLLLIPGEAEGLLLFCVHPARNRQITNNIANVIKMDFFKKIASLRSIFLKWIK